MKNEIYDYLGISKKMDENTAVAEFDNHTCLKCGFPKEKMIAIGRYQRLIFCVSCFKHEFKTKDPIKLESGKFQFWVDAKNG